MAAIDPLPSRIKRWAARSPAVKVVREKRTSDSAIWTKPFPDTNPTHIKPLHRGVIFYNDPAPMWNKWWRGPRQFRLVFLAVMILLATTLGCVAWWLLKQDQQLSVQRLGEWQDTAADLTVAALENRLSTIEQNLNRILTEGDANIVNPASGAVYVQFQGNSIRSWPDNGLVYSPAVRELPEPSDAPFTVADQLEFQKHDYSGAVALLREPAASSDPRIRAAAFARIARINRKAGQPQDSLKAAGQLASLGAAEVSGMPAALAGQLARIYLFEQQKEQEALVSETKSLESTLQSGRWKISPATYSTLSGEVHRILGHAIASASLAEGVDWIWERWNTDHTALSAGRQNLTMISGPVLLLWKSSKNTAVGFAANGEYLDSEWLAELKPRLENLHVQLVLTDLEGHPVLGKAPNSSTRPAIKLIPETGLPWTIQVFSDGSGADEFRSRRKLLIAGMAILFVLILTGTWFVGHAVSRELAVARLQTDFVATVSHEFRTPLTTLCQLSELLKRDRVAGEDDRRQYYELLYTESNRLRRLVETLLNFGRLEAGRLQFHFEEVDAAALVRQSAAEFIESQLTHGHRLEIQTPEAPLVRADRETLRCVFWNLFENAVKYSPGCDTVWVNLSRRGLNVEIEVCDRGVGIPRGEHRRIFERFVRGEAARESNISGTGIGLAMARQIVLAHGGDITVESEPGKGSTFRVVLPEMQANV